MTCPKMSNCKLRIHTVSRRVIPSSFDLVDGHCSMINIERAHGMGTARETEMSLLRVIRTPFFALDRSEKRFSIPFVLPLPIEL